MKSVTLPDDHDLCARALLRAIDQLRVGRPARGVLHVGAHMGEEVPIYLKHGYSPIYLVEANPEVLPALMEKFNDTPDVKIINTAIGEEVGNVEFIVHRTAKGSMESAGILPLDKLGKIVPVFDSRTRHVVPICTLDSLADRLRLYDMIDLMVLDIQGAELKALSSARRFLCALNFVVCEVNLIRNYAGCPLEPELDEFMTAAGFKKEMAIYHELYDANGCFPAWGECLWHR